MGTPYGRIPTRGPAYQQNDSQENRQRVATYVDGNSVAYEGSLTSGPDVLCDFHTDAGRNAHYGYLINDGEGDLQVLWSSNGTTFGGIHTVRKGEQISFDGFTVNQLKLRWITNCDYRIMLM
jgi:hypothetical protein